MKDFPIFPTEYGVVSLTLREIPYRAEAYIQVQDVQPGALPRLLEECVGFCRACGAERVYAAGRADFPEELYHGSLIEMNLCRREIKLPEASLWPVTEETAERFRTIYNEAMATVDYARTLTAAEKQALAASGGAYFVHREGRLLGIGWVEGEELRAIASVVPGMGETVAQALLSVISGERVRLEAASRNERAIRLYERLGFLKTAELQRWYQVFPTGFTNIPK